MAKRKNKKRKPTKAKEKIDFRTILISAAVDLIVGLILILAEKLFD